MADEKKERIFENTHSRYVKTKEILSIKVTADEHVFDSKPLPELVNGIIKSDSMTTTTGKLFADDGANMKVMLFLDIWETLESRHA